LANVPRLDELIREVRGQKVIFDTDLARIYGIPTFRFNEAVKRNRERFPEDFMFQLTSAEVAALTSQFAISKPRNSSQIAMSLRKHRGKAYRPYAFTEHGAIMAANVLNSPHAVQMSVFVVRAFLKMRALLGDKRELAQKLVSLEKELKKRLDVHEAVIVTILQRVMDIIDPPLVPQPPKPRIGFKL
jgi:ORF6N domain